jgi:putative ATP-dependent endonuclease of OLD family
MKLKTFIVERFRIFSTKEEIHFSEMSVLVGPNNEGKTTACDALEIFFSELGTANRKSGVTFGSYRRRRTRRNSYVLTRDYPLGLPPGRGRRWPSSFSAKFELDPQELVDLSATGVSLRSSELTVALKWAYKQDRLIFSVADMDVEQTQKILAFVKSRFRFISVPAIRDEATLNSNLQALFEEATSAAMEKSRRIQRLKNQLEATLGPEVEKTAKSLQDSIKSLLPEIRNVEFDWNINLERSIDVNEITVDDGLKTSIDLKGDGVKSLIVLAQLTYLATDGDKQGTSTLGRSRLFVIEEPESHLNSFYLYNLKDRLRELSSGNQVLITTHSPVFVDFTNKKSVNLISKGRIRRPQKKSDVADALGVQIQENLRSNNVGVICEGTDDEMALRIIIGRLKGEVQVLEGIDIIASGGAGNIPVIYSSNRQFYGRVLCVLDNDEAGSNAHQELQRLGVKDADLWICPKEPGFKSAELEDLLDVKLTIEILKEYFSRAFSPEGAEAIRSRYKTKFSEWIVPFVNQAGLPLSDKEAIKRAIWDGVSKRQNIQLSTAGTTMVDAFIETIKGELKK